MSFKITAICDRCVGKGGGLIRSLQATTPCEASENEYKRLFGGTGGHL